MDDLAEQLGAEPWPPVVLAASQDAGFGTWLAALVGPHGYVLWQDASGAAALERVRTVEPDVMLLDADLPDIPGEELCRRLHEERHLAPHVPILLLSAAIPPRDRYLAALGSGAWDWLTLPLDGDALLLRLATFGHSKLFTDWAREDSLIDGETGFYNVRGLARRAHELGALAARQSGPLACVALAPDVPPHEAASLTAAAAHCVRVLKAKARPSDAVGRVGRAQYAVIAPATDAKGAVGLADRLRSAIEDATKVRVRAGYDAVDRFADAPLSAVNLVAHANTALRTARADSPDLWIQPYEEDAG